MSRGRFDQTRNTIVPGEGMNFKWVDVEEEEEEEEDSIVISGLVQRIYRKSFKKREKTRVFLEGLRNLLEVDFFFSFPPPVRVITGRNNYYRVVNEEKRRARNFHDGVWRITKRWPLLSRSFHDRFAANSKQDVRKIERGDNRSIT